MKGKQDVSAIRVAACTGYPSVVVISGRRCLALLSKMPTGVSTENSGTTCPGPMVLWTSQWTDLEERETLGDAFRQTLVPSSLE